MKAVDALHKHGEIYQESVTSVVASANRGGARISDEAFGDLSVV